MSNGDDDAYLEGSWNFKSYEAPGIALGIEKLSALGVVVMHLSFMALCMLLFTVPKPMFSGLQSFYFSFKK